MPIEEAVVAALVRAAAKVVDAQYHRHTDQCYGAYAPCGEHHRHTGPNDLYPCGVRPLLCRRKASTSDVNELRDIVLPLYRAVEGGD